MSAYTRWEQASCVGASGQVAPCQVGHVKRVGARDRRVVRDAVIRRGKEVCAKVGVSDRAPRLCFKRRRGIPVGSVAIVHDFAGHVERRSPACRDTDGDVEREPALRQKCPTLVGGLESRYRQ